jgi:hypothetical protein
VTSALSEVEEQGFVTAEMIEDGSQKSGLSRGGPQIAGAKTRQSQKLLEPFWVTRKIPQGLNRNRLSIGFGELGFFAWLRPEIEILHYNGFPFVNFYPLITAAAELSRAWSRRKEPGDCNAEVHFDRRG